MPDQPQSHEQEMQKAGEDLFNFAIDREDVKWLLAKLPSEVDSIRIKVEYELQILKIIAVGWTISFHMEEGSEKTELLGSYWSAVHQFSGSLSSTTQLLIDQRIDYFQTIRDRLDQYVKSMAQRPEAREPAAVIGPEFSRICGSGEDIQTIVCGTRMFVTVMARVKEYLDSISKGLH
jgi:hypothetical protein